ncbi:MAG: hypothetical protein KIT12_10255, partial [Trueperaceae bacterium]|nr:hypothetical protein [Trueperaceae bacterium]
MIATMDQVVVVGRRSRAKDVLTSLQSLGVVQVDALEPGEKQDAIKRLRLAGAELEAKESWDRIVARSSSLVAVLGVQPDAQARVETGSDPAAIERDLAQVGAQVDRLVAERGEITDELELIGTYQPLLRDLAPLQGPLDDSKYLGAIAFLMEQDGLDKIKEKVGEPMGGAVAFAARPYKGGLLALAVTLRSRLAELRSALGRLGVAEVALPESYAGQGVAKAAHRMEERARVLPQRLESIRTDLAKLASQHGSRLAAIDRVAHNNRERYARLEDLAEGRYGFALQGW